MFTNTAFSDVTFFEKPTDTTGYELDPIQKNGTTGEYLFPNMPCGILPFYINEESKIVWGCVETNRVGVKSISPPTGTQDIIAIKGAERFVIEVAKPLQDFNKDFLTGFTGKTVSGQNYQDILNCFVKNGYRVFLENVLATAAHETKEELGVDLRKNCGVHNNLLLKTYDFDPQTVLTKRGTVTQKVFVAHLNKIDGITLNYTNKVEEKIAINKGRSFYEKGIWCTLEDLKSSFEKEKSAIENGKDNTHFNTDQIALIKSEFIANGSRISLIEKIEGTIVANLSDFKINSTAQPQQIAFRI